MNFIENLLVYLSFYMLMFILTLSLTYINYHCDNSIYLLVDIWLIIILIFKDNIFIYTFVDKKRKYESQIFKEFNLGYFYSKFSILIIDLFILKAFLLGFYEFIFLLLLIDCLTRTYCNNKSIYDLITYTKLVREFDENKI